MATMQIKDLNQTDSSSVNMIKNKSGSNKNKKKDNKNSEVFKCARCGTEHKKKSCPAYKKKCDK